MARRQRDVKTLARLDLDRGLAEALALVWRGFEADPRLISQTVEIRLHRRRGVVYVGVNAPVALYDRHQTAGTGEGREG